MTYLESVQFVREIESKYDVLSIKFKGVPIWPYLRIKIIEQISGADTKLKPSTKSGVRQVLSTLFYYNPLRYFKKSKVWLFSSFERRKMVGERAVMRVSGGIVDANPETLVFEKPVAYQSKTPRKFIQEKNIVSESWILLFVHLLSFLLKPFHFKIEGGEILNEILADNNLKFDYRSEVRLLFSQKKTIDILLWLTHKPKLVFIECPYTIMGYVWSFHEHGIHVTELQHGVLNEHHYAYNSLYHSEKLYPDRMCVFGEVEYDYLMSNQCYYCNDVICSGLYFLEIADNSFAQDIFSNYRDQYDQIVLVAGQTGFEKQMSDFVNQVSSELKNVLFVYVPRTKDEQLDFHENNVIFRPGVNIYEYMKWCDIHLTISSTTCLECQYFKKPTIFYNYEGMSTNYYSKVLSPENGACYINKPVEFENALGFIGGKMNDFTYREIFAHGSVNTFAQLMCE